MSKVYVGDIGTEIVLDCGTSIVTATTLKIKVRKPSGQLVEWTATLKGTTQMSYITQSGDLSVDGVYRLQAYVVMTGWTGRGETADLIVYKDYA